MKLTTEQLRSIVHGALFVREEKGEVILSRFTDTQKEYYRLSSEKDPSNGFFRKTYAGSGIRLEFVTDSDTLSFSYHTQHASSRRFYYFDIFVDGVMVEHFGKEDVAEDTGAFSMELPCGTHTVCIYLPCLAEARLYDFTLSDGAFFRPVERKVKLLCYGDSITQGYDAKYPSQTYANQLADKLGASMVDQGIGGEHFCPGLIAEDIGFTPDIITVAYGTNDWSNQDPALTVERANAFYKGLRERYPNAKIFAITPIWRADNHRITKVGTFEQGRDIVRNAARAAGVTAIIEGDGMIPHLAEACADEYLHPNDFGFKFYANALYNAIAPYLEVK